MAMPDDSYARRDAAFSPLTDQNAPQMMMLGQHLIARVADLANLVMHTNEMYGTSAEYLRATGIVPPPTERQAPVADRGR